MSERKTSYHHGDLRAALLTAVGKVIEEDGVGAVSLRAAARGAGVSHAAPAHHFGDKRGMLNAFAIQGFQAFRARMDAASSAAENPQAAMHAIGMMYVEFAMTEPAWFDVMFRTELHDKDDPELQQAAYAAFDVLAQAVGDLVATGDCGDVDPTLIALDAWSRVHGLATLWRDGVVQMFVEGPLKDIAARLFEMPTYPGSS